MSADKSPRATTPVTVRDDGTETHESWIKLTASKVTSTPGRRLFDSEIPHTHYVRVGVHRCTRERHLNNDWTYASQTLMEFSMSHAQWGAFVSSFGEGGGVPATLDFHEGQVPQAPAESRLGESVREVRGAADKSLSEIRAGYEQLAAAFDRGAGKREMRDLIHSLGARVKNGPANMAFAADQLSEHVENVVTKARADLEAMASAVADSGDHSLESGTVALLGEGE